MRHIKASDKQETILIGKDYRLSKDGLQWILEHRRAVRRTDKTKKKELWVLVGYYPKIQQVYDSLIEHKLKQADLSWFQNLIETVNQAKEEIRASISIDRIAYD